MASPQRKRRSARRAACVAILAILAAVVAWPHAAPEPVLAGNDDPADRTRANDVSTALAGEIDRHIRAQWAKAGLKPSDAATDAEWLRRLRIDLTGTVPTPDEIIAFVKSKSANKRVEKIDELLASEEWPVHWGSQLSAAFVGRGSTGQDGRGAFISAFMIDWFVNELASGRGYDEVMGELIRTEGWMDEEGNGSVAFYVRYPGAAEVSGAISRLVFGTQIQCAQCHDHPYTDTTQKDFFGMAGFFARTQQRRVNLKKKPNKKPDAKPGEKPAEMPRRGGYMDGGGMQRPGPGMDGEDIRGMMLDRIRQRMREGRRWGVQETRSGEIRIPKPGDTDREMIVRTPNAVFRPDVIDPTFIDGTMPKRKSGKNRRDQLASLISAEGSELFSKAQVNRIWAAMFGRGIVDPIDDLEAGATHPELLATLAKGFEDSGYDLRSIIRAIALSDTYALSSVPNESNAGDAEHYARSYLRPLPPEALFGSLMRATGVDEVAAGEAAGTTVREQLRKRRQKGKRGARRKTLNPRDAIRMRLQLLQRFIYAFDDDEGLEALDYESSIPQALMFLNGELTNRGVEAGIAQVLEEALAGRNDDEARIQHVFLRSVGRLPEKAEMRQVTKMLKSAEGDDARRQVFEDVFWALLNSSEFFFNH